MFAVVYEDAWRQDRWESMTYNRTANTSLAHRCQGQSVVLVLTSPDGFIRVAA